MTTSTVIRQDNRILVRGELYDLHRFMAILHTATNKLGYQDIILDMSECTAAFQNSMLAICASVIANKGAGIGFKLIPPIKRELRNLFANTNWGHFLDPDLFPASNFKGHTRVPAIQYKTPEEQQAAVCVFSDFGNFIHLN